jgi:hypothetical protein
VAVDQALDDPGGLQIDEHGEVVGALGRRQHAHHRHLQRIDAGEVEQGLGRGQQGIAGFEPKEPCRTGAEHAFAEQRQVAPGLDLEAAEVEVVQIGADNGLAAGLEAHVQRDRQRQPGVCDGIDGGHGDRLRHRVAEVQAVHRQVQGAALGADHQRRALGACEQLALALVEQQLQRAAARRSGSRRRPG